SKNLHNNLSMIELEIMSYLNSQGGSGLWSDISRKMQAGNEFHERFERYVHNGLEEQGYFDEDSFIMFRNKMHSIQIWAGTLLSIAFVMIPIRQSFQYSQLALGKGF